MYRQVPKLFDERAVGMLLIGPALREHTFDPALEQGGERPPVHRIDQHQRIGAGQALLFGQHIGRRLAGLDVDRNVGRGDAWIEAFGRQIGDVGSVGRRQAVGDFGGHGVGEGLGIGVRDDDEGVHGRGS